MDALSGIGGQWAYGSASPVTRSQPGSAPRATSSAATAATPAATTANAGTIADVIAANGSAQASAGLISSPGYADVMAALANQAAFTGQALGGNLDIQM